MTNFRDSQSALGLGFKVRPNDIAGLLGSPQVGNVWYVDGLNGLDTNPGNAANQAFKTLYAAHNAATDNNYDQIIVVPTGTGSGTGTTEETYGRWTFSKNLVTVIGAPAPSRISQRSRILWSTAGQSTTTLPLLTISGNGNSFVNLQFATFVDNNVLVKLTGDRNFFSNIHFAGIGDATAGDDADAKSLWLADGDENFFSDCVIGLDTVARSTTNTELQVDAGSQRNQFEDCLVICFADNSGHFFVKLPDSGSIDRWVIFKRCGFINPTDSTATAMTDAMSVHATPGGSVFLIDCYKLGATGWANSLTSVQALGTSSNATYADGIGYVVNPSA